MKIHNQSEQLLITCNYNTPSSSISQKIQKVSSIFKNRLIATSKSGDLHLFFAFSILVVGAVAILHPPLFLATCLICSGIALAAFLYLGTPEKTSSTLFKSLP